MWQNFLIERSLPSLFCVAAYFNDARSTQMLFDNIVTGRGGQGSGFVMSAAAIKKNGVEKQRTPSGYCSGRLERAAGTPNDAARRNSMLRVFMFAPSINDN